MSDRITIKQVYSIMSRVISLRSTCERQRNGAVITSLDGLMVFSMGYNGVPHDDEHCKGGKPGDCGCVHAELNALLKKHSFEPAIMYMTTSPCMNCAKAIVQSNIVKIYYIDEYRLTDPIVYLKLKNIDVEKISLADIGIITLS